MSVCIGANIDNRILIHYHTERILPVKNKVSLMQILFTKNFSITILMRNRKPRRLKENQKWECDQKIENAK